MRTLIVLLLAAAAALGGAHDPPAPTPARSRVFVIVMENKAAQQVLSSPGASYLRALARRYGDAVSSYAVTHPSLPNYVALLSGSTQGVHGDCKACRADGPNLTDQLEHAHRSWGAYVEGLPGPCGGRRAGRRYTTNVDALAHDSIDPSRCVNREPLTRLTRGLRRGRLPDFALVMPNLCHDTHSCPIRTGDRFLAGLVPRLLHAAGPRGFLVLTYDEGNDSARCCGGSHGGRIATIVAGPLVRRGARMRRPIDHYGVLRSLEDAFGLPHLGAAHEARHGSLGPLFVGGAVPRVG